MSFHSGKFVNIFLETFTIVDFSPNKEFMYFSSVINFSKFFLYGCARLILNTEGSFSFNLLIND
jgi:hypothetical protein